LQIVPLNFRAEIEMSALAIQRALQRRSKTASARIEHPAIEAELNNAWRGSCRRLTRRDNDDGLLRKGSQLQILAVQPRLRQQHEGGVDRLHLQCGHELAGPVGRDSQA